jgi:DNA-directed RNA polymerase subunit L
LGNDCEMQVQLRTTGAKSPALAIQHALENLQEEVRGLSDQFKAEAGRVGYRRH